MSNPKNQLSDVELVQIRAMLDERAPRSGPELALAMRSESATTIAEHVETYWALVHDKTKLDYASFIALLIALGRRVQQFEADMRAVEMQRRAEQKQEEDRQQRDLILEGAKPAQEKLDAAVAGIFGADWQQQLNSGDMVEAPYLTDLERGTVTTKIAALREPCAALEKALAGIESCFVYGWKAAPSFLTDAREAFDLAVAAHVERQRIPA